ncbi:hypothetical protein VTL71DRAFT_5470, partial [Oculimacula yallundae]
MSQDTDQPSLPGCNPKSGQEPKNDKNARETAPEQKKGLSSDLPKKLRRISSNTYMMDKGTISRYTRTPALKKTAIKTRPSSRPQTPPLLIEQQPMIVQNWSQLEYRKTSFLGRTGN